MILTAPHHRFTPRRIDRLMHTPLLLIAIWASLLVTFVVARPSPTSPLSWLLIGSAMLVGVLYMQLSNRENRRTQRATDDWLEQVDALVDVHDFEDDGHLAEYLDDAEQRGVIEVLQRMPVGSRSLRRAIEIVSPELLNGGATEGEERHGDAG